MFPEQPYNTTNLQRLWLIALLDLMTWKIKITMGMTTPKTAVCHGIPAITLMKLIKWSDTGGLLDKENEYRTFVIGSHEELLRGVPNTRSSLNDKVYCIISYEKG